MFQFYFIFLLFTFINGHLLENNILKKSSITAAPIKTDADALQYLMKYGYDIPSGCSSEKIDENKPLRQSSIETMVENFQTKFNLPVTGKLDHATITLMKKPRCGLEDLVAVCHASRPWSNTTLKWKLYNEISTLNKNKVRSQIQQAFDDWARYTQLKFHEVTGNEKADFHISFQTGEHGDQLPFDGPGGNIAHAFSPKNGTIHFDATENWTDKFDGSGYNLRVAAVHAIGHVLGLSHSHDSKSIMYPFYQLFRPTDLLPKEDRDTIRVFYGTNKRTTPSRKKTTISQKKPKEIKAITKKTKPIKPQTSSHDRCTRFFDIAFGGGPDKLLYTFDNNLVWRYHSDTDRWDSEGTPVTKMFHKSIRNFSIGAFSPKTNKIYLFKFPRVWRYTSPNKIDAGFPRPLPGTSMPNHPIAVLYEKNHFWFIQSGELYKLDEQDNLKYDDNHPKRRISEQYPGIPNDIRTAFTFNEKHYFFTESDRKVYIFDIKKQHLEPGYPKPMATGWFACKGK